MTTLGGYQRHVLRVNLIAGAVTKEPVPPEDILRKFIGGTGLGVYYLLREAPMDVAATDPRAPLYFMTGPLAGTLAPASANWVTICFHFSIPYAAGVGHGHGFWAARLKHAGYEGILIYGRAARPTYLWVDDDRVELRDASRYWGLGTRETERQIKADLGDEAGISVACIGPGGEAQMPGGMIKVDRNHGAGKGSPGSIMGSKNLKAIAVRGTGRVPIADPDAFGQATSNWQKLLEARPDTSIAGILYDAGHTRWVGTQPYKIAFKNMTDPEGGMRAARNFREAASRWKVTPKPSYNCPIGCAYDLQITDGPFSGFRASLCGGGENTDGAAGMVGVDDAAEQIVLTDHYDDMGLEAGTFGSLMGAAFEAYERGLLTKEDTDGLELTWGNFDATMALIEKTIKREGIGAKLAAGLKEAARLMGESHGAADEFRKFTLHVKGAGINIHDWRPWQSMLFGYIVAGFGPAHFGMGSDSYPLAEAGIAGGKQHKQGISRTLEEAIAKVASVRISAFFKMWWDSLGVCWFAEAGVAGSHPLTVESVRHATGWSDFTHEHSVEVGERIVNALRLIYQWRGFTKKDEFDYSPRYTEPAPVGPTVGHSIDAWVPQMVDEYYRLLGWDVATGYVTRAGLDRLGLSEFANGSRKTTSIDA